LALRAMGKADPALQTIGKALALAESEGYQSAFVDEGEPMARLLYQASAQGISPGYAGKLLAVLSRKVQAPAPPPNSPAADLVEPLSARELEVLQLIATGLSNSEIASRLYISLSTVKGHTSSIYGKLGVKNRSQAVAHARSLGLLPPS
jgi:LuxR family maltose regulon positive regulatory protein